MELFTPETEEQEDTEIDLKEPSMYKVLLHNDDYTPMDYVIEILVFVFNKPPEIAAAITLSVHRHGSGVCGVYTHDVAETKISTVHTLASEKGFPLRCTMEEEA